MVSENGSLVSIIIPTYNNANTICRSVDSCINQICKNIEIIVIKDGSTGNTKEVLNLFFKSFIVFSRGYQFLKVLKKWLKV